MPLFKSLTINSGTQLLLWKVIESESELAAEVELTEHCQDRMEGMKSEMHRRAFLSIRHLLAERGYQDRDLYYNEQGKPFLKDNTRISITHSGPFTGIILSTSEEVGIDIEQQRSKIIRIAHKFTPLQEYRTLANTEALIRKLTVVWGVKESLYKIYGTPGLSFLNHIVVQDFDLGDEQLQATIHYKGQKSTFRCTYQEFEGYTCVYASQL